MKISQNGLNLIEHYEGLRLFAYQDSIGLWTIGYGTTVYPNGKRVAKGDACTVEQADSYIRHDVDKFEKGVNDLVHVPLNQNQFDALVSFAYNLGLGNLGSSTLLKLVNKSQFDAAVNEFQKWCRAGGKVVAGLTVRRKAESNLFKTKVVYCNSSSFIIHGI